MSNRTALTGRQLIELLQNQDLDLPVVFAYNYGDHWHTTVLGQVENVEEGFAEWSDYHDMFKQPKEDSPDIEEEDEKVSRVLILQ